MKTRSPLYWVVVVFFIAVGLFLKAGQQRPRGVAQAAPTTVASHPSSIGFGSASKLTEHYQKHGAEFGAQSQDDYLRMAQALRDKPVGGDVLELVRDDGVTCRFDRSSGAFIAVNPDHTIRTFFKPNDGENYFRRQTKR